MNKIYNEMLEFLSENQIYLNEPMSKHTSFKIGGPADIFVKPKNVEELKNLIELAKKNNIQTTVIGNGSNLLVKDRWNKRNSYKTRFQRNWIFGR